jgi:hypothetical protein
MKTLKSLVLILSFLLCFCCGELNTKIDILELRSDFTETEFKAAIVGKWQSVYELAENKNVIFLKFYEQNNVKVTTKKNDAKEDFDGSYSVEFLRPASKGIVTWAKITIKTTTGELILPRVSFDKHNAFSVGTELFLRIDESPYGVLKRM